MSVVAAFRPKPFTQKKKKKGLRPDDVAKGKDTVVDVAIQWINSETNGRLD